MANPTSNYGWQMPTSTDLVTDLPADFEVFGQAVDSTVFANDAAALSATIVDAKGDLIAATAADAVSRLAVGANNTVLTADSTTATGLKWAAGASGMTLIKRSTYSAVANTGTTFDGVFTATYKNYIMVLDNSFGSVAGGPQLNWRVAAATQSTATYSYAQLDMIPTNPPTFQNRYNGNGQTSAVILHNSTPSTATSVATYNIYGVGNASDRPWMTGQIAMRAFETAGPAWTYYNTAIVADGFILTAISGTISGTVSIYGLAI